MLTDLEKYLEEKRRSLDVESADDARIWDNISRKLGERARQPRRNGRLKLFIRIRNIAAVAFILFSLGYIANDIINKRAIGRKVTLYDINQVLGQRETEYRTLVTTKTDEVRSFTTTDNLVIRELFEEIKRLDVVYDQALKDLKEIGYNDKIVNTIFDTYEKKIHLLELIILESNKENSHENNGKINL
jgi:hypothetical protein